MVESSLINKDSISRGYGSLAMSLSTPWQKEKNLHLNDRYFNTRNQRLQAVPNDKIATCYFCGFPDDYFLELHHLNGDHDDYSHENLVFACSLCHRLHHLGWLGIENLGKLIYLPPAGKQTEVKEIDAAQTEGADDLPPLKLELINLLQRYLMLKPLFTGDQNIRNNAEQELLEKIPLAQSFGELTTLINSSGMQNIYFKEKIAQELKAKASRERTLNQGKEQADNKQAQEIQKNESSLPAGYANNELVQDILNAQKQIPGTEEKPEPPSTKELAFHSFTTESLNLLDLIQLLGELDAEHYEEHKNSIKHEEGKEKTPSQLFFEHQEKGVDGRFIIEFKPRILEPWDKRLHFTLKERLDYYTNTLKLTNIDGLLNSLSGERYKSYILTEEGEKTCTQFGLFIEWPRDKALDNKNIKRDKYNKARLDPEKENKNTKTVDLHSQLEKEQGYDEAYLERSGGFE